MPALFVLLWSSGFTFVALGLPHSEPITFLALRYVIVVAVLAVAFAVVRPPLPRRRAWLDLAIVGFLLQAVYFGLFYLAIDRVAPATVALIVCLQPVLVALLAPALVGEHVPLARWAGLGLASLYENSFGTEQHPVTSNLVQFSVALVATAIPAALFEDLQVEWTGDLYISLAYLVFFNSLLALTLLLTMMRRGTASQVSALFFLVPPLAALIAWIVLGESLPVLAWLGMVLAAVGVAVATRR